MPNSNPAGIPAVRVTSAPYAAPLLGVTAERIADGVRLLLLRDSMTIREGREFTARILGQTWPSAYVT